MNSCGACDKKRSSKRGWKQVIHPTVPEIVRSTVDAPIKDRISSCRINLPFNSLNVAANYCNLANLKCQIRCNRSGHRNGKLVNESKPTRIRTGCVNSASSDNSQYRQGRGEKLPFNLSDEIIEISPLLHESLQSTLIITHQTIPPLKA